jgi:hypothetical protein
MLTLPQDGITSGSAFSMLDIEPFFSRSKKSKQQFFSVEICLV